MPFCRDCSKLRGYDEIRTDDVQVDIDEEIGTVSISGQLVLPCAECGSDLRCLNVDETQEMGDEFGNVFETVRKDVCCDEEALKKYGGLITEKWVEANASVEYHINGFDVEPSERMQTTTTRKLKDGTVKEVRITNSRYMKTYRGATISGTVGRMISYPSPVETGKTLKIEDETDFSTTVEGLASGWDEC